MIEKINYSQFRVLAECEQKFVYDYVAHLEDRGPTWGRNKGTLLHKFAERWRAGAFIDHPDGPFWPDSWDTYYDGEVSLADFPPEMVDDATWLARRYIEHYGPGLPEDWKLISNEERWEVEITQGQTFILQGGADAVVEIDGELWLWETKSYGDRARLEYIEVDPQLVLYKILVEAATGLPIVGVIYDGIYTKRWVPKKPTQKEIIEAHPGLTNGLKGRELQAWARAQVEAHPGVERPASESFDRREPTITEQKIERAKQYLASAVSRRAALVADPELALPNVGNGCRYCGFKEKCWDDLGSDAAERDEPEIDFIDDEDVL